MMGDLELDSFSIEESRAQWESFPLKKGLVPHPKQGRKKPAQDDSMPPEAFQPLSAKPAM